MQELGLELTRRFRPPAERLSRPATTIVLEEENSIVAMGALKIISPTEAEIKRMRVEPSRQRRGLGQQVLDNLLSCAKERGIERLILDTTELQRAAQQFYQKNGFVEYTRGRWNDHILIFYEKRLRPPASVSS